MIHIRDEGEAVKAGLNFYPLKSESSIGFVFKYGNTTRFVRYSKLRKRFFFTKYVTDQTV